VESDGSDPSPVRSAVTRVAVAALMLDVGSCTGGVA
jgi:hypothetical protein